MSIRLSCPSCNSHFALPAIPADRRATCPRCGEAFTVRGGVVDEADETSSSPAKHETPSTKHQTPRRTGRIVLVLALIAVAVGLTVFYTRPKHPPQPEPPLVVNVTPPAQLVGLGYLPAECNVVFAVQPGPLVAFAERHKQEPRELLAQTGIPPVVLSALDQIGLTLPQIDHIVGGLHIGDEGDELRIALALVLKQPLDDEAAFLQKLKAKPLAKKTARWGIELSKVPVSPVLAKASPTVWVIGLNEGDFASVEKGGFGPGGTHFRGSEVDGFRNVIASVRPNAAVWAAADDARDWTQKPLVKLAMRTEAKQWLPAVKEGRGGLVAISFGEQPQLNLVVRTRDAETAEHTQTYFQARVAEIPGASSNRTSTRVQFEAPFDPATSWPLLQRFLADATK